MSDENKKNKYAKDMEVIISKVSSEVVGQEIKKITFTTNKGNVTWKPKVERRQMLNGMECNEKVAMQITNMPIELIEFNQTINRLGSVKAIICYGIFDTEQDGQPVTYRFIKSFKEFKKWKLVEDNVNEEIVE
jgi:hypothetical protein